MIGPLEYVIPGRLAAYDPKLSPAELQARAERDDPCWAKSGHMGRPRFRLMPLADAGLWSAAQSDPWAGWIRGLRG